MKEHYYGLCCQHIGQDVEITTHDGSVYRGSIQSVNTENVYLLPYHDDGSGRFFPVLGAALVGLGLGSIAGFALAPRPFAYGYGYGYGGVAPYPGGYGGFPGGYGGFPGGYGGFPGGYGGFPGGGFGGF
ncbi:hypothetical protein LCY76_05275 [Fictibacillus sp. KIGAM418]|uniref:Uncharacterized protein n=1 Tax=Fictibacillus marinisediminis TaxID=2878389 RepID=A0A9X2BC10_9BACL|nr:hypothetical protein [Fictibacillus marinisediminis]MCK6256016.1 hypothetical protein [Fictibacillus marinisediminis]